MYIPQTIIDDVLEQLRYSDDTFVCNKEVAEHFRSQGYSVSESNTGFRHWTIKK